MTPNEIQDSRGQPVTANQTPGVRFLRMLGFARRAGKVSIGTNQAIDAARHGRAALVILSSGASPGTGKQVRNKCAFYRVPLIVADIPPDQLAHTVGADAPVASLAVLDPLFAAELHKSSGKEVSDLSEQGM